MRTRRAVIVFFGGRRVINPDRATPYTKKQQAEHIAYNISRTMRRALSAVYIV